MEAMGNDFESQLIGRKANRSGIGARVTIVFEGRSLVGEVRSDQRFFRRATCAYISGWSHDKS